MNLFGHSLRGFPKALAVLAAFLLVASGVCGVDYVIKARNGWRIWGYMPKTPGASAVVWLDLAGCAVIILSVAGIVLVSISWLIRSLYRVLGR